MSIDLLSTSNRVETPFIVVEIAGVKFGAYQTKDAVIDGRVIANAQEITYPNFMKSLTVNKINGTVNTYTLQLVYAIRNGDDPNLLEKVFSKAKQTRTMYISYGDLSTPTYTFKREETLITDVRSDIDFSGSKINYTVTAVSKGILSAASKFNFPRIKAKPSDVILKLLYDNRSGLLEVFYGMISKYKVLQNKLIATDDAEVVIEAKNNCTPLEYLRYLVECMKPSDSSIYTDELLSTAMYRIYMVDDISGDINGPYFKVVKLSRNIQKDTLDVYNIDVGYPDKNIVLDFKINDSQTYSIFYDYAGSIKLPTYIQRIDNQGNLTNIYSPALSNSSQLLRTTAADETWWTNMVNYPISATIRIKGLIKPAVLMSYVYIDARFFGWQHYASGYYIITKQTDTISASGYRTELTLLKVGGENISGN